MRDADLLRSIDQMLPELATTERAATGLRSPRPTTHPGAPTTTTHLPFGLDRTHSDDPDEPADSRSTAGILLWAAQWATAFELWYGKALDGALPYLATIAPTAATGHPDEWAALMDEARPIWTRTARTCGHLPEPAGDCWCGHTLYREPTRRGLTDHMVCDGPAEHWYADPGHYAAEYQRNARLITTPGRMLTLPQLRTVWPTLDRRTLHSWVARGHVTKHGAGDTTRYDLAHVNARMQRQKEAA